MWLKKGLSAIKGICKVCESHHHQIMVSFNICKYYTYLDIVDFFQKQTPVYRITKFVPSICDNIIKQHNQQKFKTTRTL